MTIAVDATTPGAPIERVWAFHGFDEVNYGTTAPGRDLLGTLGQIHTTPPHIRNHFLLNSGDGTPSFKWGSTNVYTADAKGNPVYDWTLTDGLLDAITGAGALPYVEIGFMPHDLSVHPDPYQNSGIYTLDGGCFYPPTDYTKWGALIGAWATHANGRYPDVSGQWQWELWNEPDIGYWHGTAAEYDKLFDYTEAAIHQVLPNARLGGPAVASSGAFFTQFLQHASGGMNSVTGTAGTRLDLISFHAKGGVAVVNGHVEMNLGNQLALHRAGFNAVAQFAQYKQTPIVISEADPDGCAACPASQNPADAYRLSPAYGAYEIAMMKRTLELEGRVGVKVGGLLTWAFLFNAQPSFAGYRVLSTNGIHLPVLNDFKLLGRLAGARLPLTSSGALSLDTILNASVRQQPDVDGMATLDGQSIQILVWNYHDDLVTAPASTVHLSVKVPGSLGARLVATHTRVDDAHGDPYTVWLSQGSPASPNAAEQMQLQQAMDPVVLSDAQPVDVVAGVASLDFDLPRFGVSLVTLGPATLGDASAGAGAPPGAAATSTAPGVADAAPTGRGDAAPSNGAAGSGSGGSAGASSSGGASPTGSTGSAAPVSPGTGGSQNAAAMPGAPARSGCACGVAGRGTSALPVGSGLVLGVAIVRRRRRRARLLRRSRSRRRPS
ncbi:MAG: hypothetical protein JOZ69_23215 [Myxococcales bacterium]|nr:hypothetical protein [Myxococcales bacterium]